MSPASPSLAERYGKIVALIEAGELKAAGRALEDAGLPAGARARAEGLIAFASGDAAGAAIAFQGALELEEDPALRLYLARAQLESGEAAAALETLSRLPGPQRARNAAVLLTARAHLATGATGATESAWNGLAEAERAAASRPADQAELRVELLWLSLQLGWRGQARAWAHGLADTVCSDELPISRRDELSAGILAALGEDRGSITLFESLAACRPGDPEARAGLARLYALDGHAWTAARLYAEAAELAEGARARELWLRAADLHLIAGDLRVAEACHRRAWGHPAADRQRLEILFAAGQWARVSVWSPASGEAPVRDERATYLMAFANYRLNNRARATTLARTLIGTEFEPEARSLLAAMGRRSVAEAAAQEATP